MHVNTANRHVIELAAGGPADPDGSRAAAVLSAYFHAEHTRAFRQLLWPRLAVLATVWCLGRVAALFSRDVMVGGLAVFAAVAIGAAVIEWRASEMLLKLLRVSEREPC